MWKTRSYCSALLEEETAPANRTVVDHNKRAMIVSCFLWCGQRQAHCQGLRSLIDLLWIQEIVNLGSSLPLLVFNGRTEHERRSQTEKIVFRSFLLGCFHIDHLGTYKLFTSISKLQSLQHSPICIKQSIILTKNR